MEMGLFVRVGYVDGEGGSGGIVGGRTRSRGIVRSVSLGHLVYLV